MPDIEDGASVEIQGSGAKPYVLKNVGGVYSCTCPAWRNQSIGIERRTCKHLRKYRGDAAEDARIGKAPAGEQAESPSEVTESTAGPPLLLAEAWDNALDLSGWWMSEKLDGVRAYWDGRQFLSRQGNRYHAPDWFVEGLPDVPLDGELWSDRRAFQRTVSIVRRQDKSDHWKSVRYVVFDAPAVGGPFEERIDFLKDGVHAWNNSFLQLHEHAVCSGLSHLREELVRVEALGGEGLMLRQPGSKYQTGRSPTLLKVKNFRDAEGEVIGHEPGKGRHKGRLGALVVRLPSGKEFSVGTGFSDRERENPPVIGSLIQFRYQELSDGGIPRFPSYVGLRSDVASGTPVVVDRRTAKTKPSAAPFEVVSQPSAAKKSPTVPTTSETRPSTSAASISSAGRYFECVEGPSSKFWEVSVEENDLTTRWGRIGTDGQSKTKSFATADKARAEHDKLVAEKVGKGYQEVAASDD